MTVSWTDALSCCPQHTWFGDWRNALALQSGSPVAVGGYQGESAGLNQPCWLLINTSRSDVDVVGTVPSGWDWVTCCIHRCQKVEPQVEIEAVMEMAFCFASGRRLGRGHPGPSASPATRLSGQPEPPFAFDWLLAAVVDVPSRSVALQTPAVKYFGSSVTALLFQFMPQGYPLCHHLIGSNDVFDLASRYSVAWVQSEASWEIFSNKARRSIMSDLSFWLVFC